MSLPCEVSYVQTLLVKETVRSEYCPIKLIALAD